jgi:hypothetical protein
MWQIKSEQIQEVAYARYRACRCRFFSLDSGVGLHKELLNCGKTSGFGRTVALHWGWSASCVSTWMVEGKWWSHM